jgi:hypothetical protein
VCATEATEINAVRMRGTYKDTRMTLTQLYSQGERRLGDTNGNNRAALPPFFVCIARSLAHMCALSLATRTRRDFMNDTTSSPSGSSRLPTKASSDFR